MLPIRCRYLAASALLLLVLAGLVHQNARAADWADTRVSGPFVCRAEFPLSQVDDLLKDLAGLQDDLVRCLGISPAREPIELYLFRDKSSYARYLKLHFPSVPYRRALYIKGRGPGMVLAYRSRKFEIDLRHECTHALLHTVLPAVPLWLDEGLAEYFELPSKKRAFDNPYLFGLRWDARLGMLAKLQELEGKSRLAEMRQREYRYSWAWVHFMLHGPKEAHEELVGFLRDLEANVPAGQLSQRLQRRMARSERRLASHLKGWKR